MGQDVITPVPGSERGSTRDRSVLADHLAGVAARTVGGVPSPSVGKVSISIRTGPVGVSGTGGESEAIGLRPTWNSAWTLGRVAPCGQGRLRFGVGLERCRWRVVFDPGFGPVSGAGACPMSPLGLFCMQEAAGSVGARQGRMGQRRNEAWQTRGGARPRPAGSVGQRIASQTRARACWAGQQNPFFVTPAKAGVHVSAGWVFRDRIGARLPVVGAAGGCLDSRLCGNDGGKGTTRHKKTAAPLERPFA